MARGDFTLVDHGGLNTAPTITWQTEAGSLAIYAGEPVRLKAAGSPYAMQCVDNDVSPGVDTIFLGITATDSTHTSTADGTVAVYIPFPWFVFEGKATTGTNVNTQAKINALCGDRKRFDLVGTTFTVDEAVADGTANSLLIIGGNPTALTLKFMIRPWVNAADAA